MKITIAILVMATNFNFYTQPYRIYPPVTEEKINNCFSLDKENYWLVGSHGLVLKTTDGGESFSDISIQTAEYLEDVSFINENIGIAVGMNNAIYMTKDGGVNWRHINWHFSTHFSACAITNDSTAFVSTWYGGGPPEAIYKTTDGGETFIKVFEGNNAKKIVFTNEWKGYALTGGGDLYGTNNQGSNWVKIFNSSYGIGDFYTTGDTVAASVYKGVRVSTNNGASWIYKSIPFGSTGKKIHIKGNLISIFDQFSSYYDYIHKSTDSGNSWTHTLVQRTGRDFSFLNKDHYLKYDYRGYLAKSTNGGNNWVILNKPAFGEGKTFLFSSNDGFSFSDGLLKTTSGGVYWDSVSAHSKGYFINMNIGFAGGQKTTDGGVTWATKFYNEWWHILGDTFQFPDSLNGFVQYTDGNNSFRKILKTTDGGETWLSYNIPNIIYRTPCHFMLNKDIGWAVDDTIAYKTTDGCLTWINTPLLKGKQIFFLNESLGWVAGRYNNEFKVRKTIDGGNTFTHEAIIDASIHIYHLLFVDEKNGYVSTDKGLFKTSDGGATFNRIFHKSIYQIIPQKENIYARSLSGGLYFIESLDPIPVQLTSFTASVQQNSVHLKWQTATETNNSGFEIKKSEDRSQQSEWKTLTFIDGNGTTTEPREYSFIDEGVESGKYKYRLKQIDFEGSFEYSQEIEVEVNTLPTEFALYQNYPNPFNPVTKIKYTIPAVETGHSADGGPSVQLKIFDILGNEVSTLVNEEQSPGEYEVEFDGSKYSSGVYFYTLQAGEFTATKKFVLMK